MSWHILLVVLNMLALLFCHMQTHFDTTAAGNFWKLFFVKGKIAHNEHFLLFPQYFQLNSIIMLSLTLAAIFVSRDCTWFTCTESVVYTNKYSYCVWHLHTVYILTDAISSNIFGSLSDNFYQKQRVMPQNQIKNVKFQVKGSEKITSHLLTHFEASSQTSFENIAQKRRNCS